MIVMPFFTVAIPTRNRPEWILRAIESVLRQTEKDFQLLIIDDASDSDKTVNVVKGVKDSRLNLIINDVQLGIAGNVNKVFEIASGEYIGFLGDDDVFDQHLLERIRLKAIPDRAQFIAYNLSLVDLHGKQLKQNYLNLADDVSYPERHYIERHFGSRTGFHIPGTFFVNRKFLDDTGVRYRPEVKGIDVFFSIEANIHVPIDCISEPLYLHTMHKEKDSSSENRNAEWYLHYYRAVSQFLDENELKYLQPLLRRKALEVFDIYCKGVFENSDLQHPESVFDGFFQKNSWLYEQHSDFGRIRLLQVMINNRQKNDCPVVVNDTKCSLSIMHELWNWSCLSGNNCGITDGLYSNPDDIIYIFGTGMIAWCLKNDLERSGMPVTAFLSTNRSLSHVWGIPVIHPEDLQTNLKIQIILSLERKDYQDVLALFSDEIIQKKVIVTWYKLLENALKTRG